MDELIALAAAVVGVAVFLAFRSRAFPVEAAPDVATPAGAVLDAAVAVRRLCGLDVTGWRAFAVLSFDDSTVDRLHQLGVAGRQRNFLVHCGLRAAWRVRFVTPGGSVLVGLSARGEVVLFDLAGSAYELAMAAAAALADDRPGPDDQDELRRRLAGDAVGGLWATVRPVGAGYRERTDEAMEHSRRLRGESADVRVDFDVDAVGGAVVRVDSTVELIAEGARGLDQADQREALASAGGVLGSVLGFIGGVAVLAFADETARSGLAVILGAAVLAATVYGDVNGFRYAAVHAYDGTLSLRAFRLTNALVAAVSALAMTGVVVVAALAGSVVAERIGMNVTGELGRQLAYGVALGAGWLGMSALGYALLRRTGLARVSPSPDRRSLRTTGMDVPHVLSITAQSATGEEAVFRLLLLPVVAWLTGVPALAVVVAAVLWAGVHSGGAVRPRWVRFTELTVVGVLLGVAALQVGFVAALTAHAAYNFVILAAPLLHRQTGHATEAPPPGRTADPAIRHPRTGRRQVEARLEPADEAVPAAGAKE